MDVKIKICGITNLDDALLAAESGADFLGFIFYAPSPRYIEPNAAGEIIQVVRAEFGSSAPAMVGVFVNEPVNYIEDCIARAHLDLSQLSGDESPQLMKELVGRTFKAIQPRNLQEAQDDIRDYAPLGAQDADYPAILIDSYHPDLRGGTGKLVDLDLVGKILHLERRAMLAGGLNPINIADVVQEVRPFGVDVSSGVEASKGKKDPQKVREFIASARAAADEIG